MPYEEEEDRVCEVKCPKGGGVCGIGATPILLPNVITQKSGDNLVVECCLHFFTCYKEW